MKVAAIQMVSGTSISANLAAAHSLLTQAAQQGAELAVLPEYFCLLGHKDTDKVHLRESPGHGQVQDFLSATARELKLWLVGGTVPLATADPTRVRNSSLAYAPSGELVARYDKIHLFRFDNGVESYDESRVLERGAALACFDLPSRSGQTWRIGLSVCYDLRFPELYRSYAQQGAQVLLVPSAFTYTTGQQHWALLLRARAIENLAYVVAPAQGGTHENGRQTWGQSLVAGPWGELLAQQASGPGVVLAELNWGHLHQCRQNLPALAHRVL